ncbi:MAG: DegV family protein [Oscillospiraceae bacterium]
MQQFHILDSRNYSGAYGYAVVKAAMMRDEGKTVPEIIAFMQDHFDHAQTYLSISDLKYAKKSGRVSGAQAFIGDALGLRPIISVIDGEMKTFAKVRGDNKALEKLADLFVENSIDLNYDFVILGGESLEPAKQLAELVFEKTGKRPFDIYRCGAALSVNSGPTIIGILVRGKKHTK